MDKIKFFALGGLDEEGKNCYCIEINNDIFVIEAGLKYAPSSQLGVDYHIPDNSYLIENKSRIKAYIISHAHDDQFGAIYNFLETAPAPVYCSDTTLSLIRYEYKKKYRQDFRYKYVLVEPSSDITIAGRKFKFFSTTHSASHSFGFAIETDQGNIVYTGDFISDFASLPNFHFDFTKLTQLGYNEKTFILLCESTAANLEGISSPKHKVKHLIEKYFQNNEGKIYVATYTQHIYNLEEIISLVIEYKKKLLIVDNNFKTLIQYLNSSNNLMIPKENLVELEDLPKNKNEDIVVLLTGNGEDIYSLIKSVTHDEIKGIHIDEKDTFILNCPSVPGTEVIYYDAVDSVYQTNCKVFNITRKILSSMHAQEEDIKMVLSILRPKYYIPVKGEYRKLMANAKIALNMNIGLNHTNTFILDNGDVLTFENGKVTPKTDKVKTGDLLVEGLSVGDVNTTILNERTRMSQDGIIILGIAVSISKAQIVSLPDIQMRGCLYLKDSEEQVKRINEIFFNTIKNMFTYKNIRAEDIEIKIEESIRKYMNKELNKDPIITANVFDIDRVKIIS